MKESLDHPDVLVPPPFIYLGYLLGALAVNWALPITTPASLILEVVGGILVVVGVGLAVWAFSMMFKAHTTPDSRQPTTALVTSGPYRFTRNPIYLGFLLIYLGFTVYAGTYWGLLLSPFLIATVTRSLIRPEEVYLDGKFHDSYKEYSARVRRWV